MQLFKYRSLHKDAAESTLRILSAREVYFSRPDSFNDPFEFRPRISLKATTKELISYFRRLCEGNCPELNRQQRKEKVAELHDNWRNHRPAADDILRATIQEVIRRCGVYCLSEDPLNILMWSHYADCHRGICLGFNGEGTNPFFGPAQQVIYQDDYPVTNPIRDNPSTILDKLTLTKASSWAYEKEWRIIKHEQGPGTYRFERDDLKQVIFGANTSHEHIEAVLQALKVNHMSPQLYRACLHEKRYEIELDPYET